MRGVARESPGRNHPKPSKGARVNSSSEHFFPHSKAQQGNVLSKKEDKLQSITGEVTNPEHALCDGCEHRASTSQQHYGAAGLAICTRHQPEHHTGDLGASGTEPVQNQGNARLQSDPCYLSVPALRGNDAAQQRSVCRVQTETR